MTREAVKEYLSQLLTAYQTLVAADAEFSKAPFSDSDLPVILRVLESEIERARRAAKYLAPTGERKQ